MTTHKSKSHGVKNSYETEKRRLPDALKSATATAKNQINGIGSDFFEQLLGFDFSSSSSEAAIDQQKEQIVLQDPETGEIVLYNRATNKNVSHGEKRKALENKPAKSENRGGIDYKQEVARSSEHASQRELGEMNQKVEQIMFELKKLIGSSRILQLEFAEITVEQAPPQVGEYHMQFFEWMLLVIKNAREKVEDSGAWLATVKGKNGKKGYWGMFKKHGTTFGLSNERAVATQVG